MTRALVVYSHPCEESLSAALHRTVVETLEGRGWEVDDCDLYAEGFDPVLTAVERRAYHDTAANTAPVQAHVDRLRAAQAIVFVFPVWNFGYPAMLKGYFDRVFLPGVVFDIKDGSLTPCLNNIRRIAAVTTYGAKRHRAWLASDPPRKMIRRAVWGLTRPEKVRYIARYDMNNITPDGCAAHLARTRAEMEAF